LVIATLADMRSMASRALQSLLASRFERSRPHRLVVRVGAVTAWTAVAVYLSVAAVTSDDDLILAATGPALAAILMTVQIMSGREDGGIALMGSGLIAAVWHAGFGQPSTTVATAVALVLIASLGMLFVDRHRTYVAAAIAVALAVVPRYWGLDTGEAAILGFLMSGCFVATSLVLITIQEHSRILNARYQMLFEESPTAVLEEDWSEAIAHVRSEYAGKPTRIRQFLRAYPTVVVEAVARSKIVRANETALRLLDVSESARFFGYRSPHVVDEERFDLFVDILVGLYEEQPALDIELAVSTRSGNLRWLHSRSVDVSTDSPGSSIIVGLADITHMKAEQDAMSKLIRAKDEFVASVSHELRTPLTAVIGLSSELAESPVLTERERGELLQLITGQAIEMSNIIDDLLVAARAEVGTVSIEPQQVELVAELQKTLDGLGMTVGQPTESIPAILADPHRVRQILRNLLTNAQRYGGPHRRVIVGTLRDRAWLEVRDDGDGVPEDDASRIFEPYATSGGSGSVGLGLAVSRQLAELMGGTLVYERSAAESVFRLELPLAERREPALASQGEQV
jgi:signal transduction histidine kinase